MTVWDLICSDFSAGWKTPVPAGSAARLKFVAARAMTVRGLATIGVRVAHAAGRRSGALGSLLKQLNQLVTGVDVDYRAQIGPKLRIFHPGAVVVAPEVVLGSHCTLHSGITLGGTTTGALVAGDHCDFAPGCRVIGPVRLGDRVRVYPNAVVTKSFGADVVLAGLPAKVVREIRDEDFETWLPEDRPGRGARALPPDAQAEPAKARAPRRCCGRAASRHSG